MDSERREREAARWRAAARSLRTPGGDSCPDDDALAALVVDGGDAAHLDLAGHVVTCEHCARRVRDLFDLLEAAGERPAARRGGRAPALIAAAAVLLAAVIGTGGWLLRDARAPAADAVVRGETAPAADTVPPEGAVLAAAPSVLRFGALPPGARARVVLLDAEATVLWESPWVEGDRVVVPDDVAAALEPGASYLWRVETRRGVEVERSPLRRFALSP